MEGRTTAFLSDTAELLDVLRSIRDDMADINSEFEAMLSRWDDTDNDPADPEQNWDDNK